MNPTLTKMMILVGVNDMPQLCSEVHIILVDCLLRFHNAYAWLIACFCRQNDSFGVVLRPFCSLSDSANRPDLPTDPVSNGGHQNNQGDGLNTSVGTIW